MVLTADKFLKFNLLDSIKNDFNEISNIFALINQVDKLHSLIVEMPAFPKTPDSIIRNELVRAVGSTTAIEGNTLSENEIKKAFEKADKNFTLQKLEQEVQNSREVYKFIVNDVYAKDINELTLPLLRQIHTITTKNLPYLSNKPGHFRTGQVEFGFPSIPSLFPDQLSVEGAAKAFIEWYNKKLEGLDGNPVIRALLSHYYLSEIHPFFDGNGRTTRAIEAFCLLSNKVLHPEFFYIMANFWVRNRDQYLAELRNVRINGSAVSFVKFGLQGLAEELEYLKNKVKKKVSTLMFSDYVQYLSREKKKVPHKLTKRMVNFLEILLEIGKTPYKDFISSPSIRALYSTVNISALSRDIIKLSESRLINLIEKDGIMIIEANVNILQGLVYRVR